jgi:hypothetical protein
LEIPMVMNKLKNATSFHTFLRITTLLGAAVMLPLTACNKPVDDATLATNVKSALAADPTIAQQPVQVAVQSGVVTLSGNVSDETASSVSAQDAAKVKDVKEVVNALTVAGLTVTPTVTSPAAPSVPRQVTRQEQTTISQGGTLPPPPASAPAPPPVIYRDITIPVGSDIPVRITQTLDSGNTPTGANFNGIVTRDIVSQGYVVVPAGAPVSGTVIESKDATHFKGSSLLSIQLTSLRRHGNVITLFTDPYTVEGKGRGKNTAEKIGGGAAIGAVLGGIFGGGKGAAIGAGAGAGGGAILQGSTRGEQVAISSESVVRFHLARSLTVHTAETTSNADTSGLQQR